MFRAVLISLILTLTPVSVWAQEAISNFDVVMQVAESGDYVVNETIEVNVEGRKIKRGIFRDLPRYYMLDELQVPFRYSVKSVTRNGQSEPYERTTDGNAYRIRIGDPEVFLPQGKQVYQITYSVKDEIRRDATSDFVYWNVTGNYWAFPIESASVRVVMPAGAELMSQEAFTGFEGEAKDDTNFAQDGNSYNLTTTRAMKRGEGLTVRLRFKKGVIAPVPDSTKRYIWWLRNGAMLMLCASFLAMLRFYLKHWNRVGRDPVKPPVFARYEPPENYSAAAVSHVHFNGHKGDRTLIATLLGLAMKKRIHIDAKKKNRTVIDRIAPPPDAAPLAAEENHLLSLLFPGGRSKRITLEKGSPHSKFHSAHARFDRHITKLYSGKYFKWNGKYITLGILLSVIAVIAAASQRAVGGFPGFGLVVIAIIALNILFFILLPAPTQYGQKMRSEIEGFKLFLKTAEEGRFDAVEVGSDAPPPMSLERYEALLPYAIALDVEDPWADYFEKVMPEEAKNYNPSWSSFSRGRGGAARGISRSIVSNISSGVSSAAPVSSSGSSGGGGGFSGGGGGGGGGGGW